MRVQFPPPQHDRATWVTRPPGVESAENQFKTDRLEIAKDARKGVFRWPPVIDDGRTLIVPAVYSHHMTMVVADVLTLRHLAKEKLKEARTLLASNRLHGATYLSGYAVEHALKYQICKHLGWKTYPPNNPLTASTGGPPQPAWKGLDSFKTHNLQVLLLISGMFEDIFSDASLVAAWDLVKNWDSEMRYEKIPNKATEKKRVKDMIDSSAAIMKELGCGSKK